MKIWFFIFFLRSLFNGCSFFQRSESRHKVYEEAGVPPKQKISTFKVSANAIIKPGNLSELDNVICMIV